MRRGTKSLLWGCHQVAIHPLFTLWGWVRLYGWGSLNIQVLLALVVHDWGYWGCKEMDGPDGFVHPIRYWVKYGPGILDEMRDLIWYHSRHLCKELGVQPSRLCWADKLGTALMPSWLWAVMAAASWEGWEYMSNPHGQDYVKGEKRSIAGLWRFHRKYKKLWGDVDKVGAHARWTTQMEVPPDQAKIEEWMRYK